MACYPGPYYGPIPGPCGPVGGYPYGGPCGPCGVCVGPCACPPLISGVGKFCAPPPSVGSAWEVDVLPMTGTTGNIWQPTYVHNLRDTTAITSITFTSGNPVVTYNLQKVKGGVCNISATIVVTSIVAGALQNRSVTVSQSVAPYTQSVTLTFNASPVLAPGDTFTGTQTTLSTRFS